MAGDGRGMLEDIGGGFQILWALLTPFLRRRRGRWGVTDEGRQRSWRGDHLVPEPRWQYLHGVAVDAPAEEVWPWVVQVGQGRGGFHSFERLENLVGCRIRNADRILPEHQDPGVGIRLHPKAPALPLALLEPGRALVLHGAGGVQGEGPGGSDAANVSWGFFVEPAGEGRCRLFSRYRADHGPGLAMRLQYGRCLVEPISFVMDRKMLRGIKARAEQARRAGGSG